MIEGKSRYQWSELNDTAVIKAMLMNADSVYWAWCSAFIQYFIEKRFSNLAPHLKDDIVQEILLLVHKGLPTFHHRSNFTTWLAAVARNRAIDMLGQQAEITQRERHLDDLPESHESDIVSDTESDIESSISDVPRTPEEIVLTQELMQEVMVMIEAFLRLHAKPERNRQILQLALFDGYSYEEIAQKLGINAPVVGYIVRSARDYLRRQLIRGQHS